ncbi:DUF3618 domain-containing protein [Trebonia sp.]|uniref:DUF3618 domain-containing protein n=1 Tax=Trebonia sp. TaxID=2767075 RepID=UPI0026043996|nr:DUF3618 domain-containing protein [Trebonia sp.]
MTTREGEEARPEQRTAVQAEDPSARAVTSGDAAEIAPLSGTVAAPPDDARRLELEIERAREQLGETVHELIARADVKARALAKATEVSGKYKSTMVEARKHAATRAAGVRGQIAGKTAAVRQGAASAGTPAWEAMPAQVRRAVAKAAGGARQHWLPLAIAAGVVIIGCLALRNGLHDKSSVTSPAAQLGAVPLARVTRAVA